MIEFRILGPLTVLDDGQPVPIPGGKERSVLALLLLHGGHPVPTDTLVDALWGSAPPATARNSLQVRVAGLRRALGADRIESYGGGYALRLEPGELDLARFEQLSTAGSADALTEALGLWHGEALVEFAQEPWAQGTIRRLDEIRLRVFEDLMELEIDAGRHDAVIGDLELQLDRHPTRERLRALLMLALYRSGRQPDALDVYRRGRQQLIDELGLEPGRMLRDLEGAILRQDPALDIVKPEAPTRSILVSARDGSRLSGVIDVARLLAERPRWDLVLARPVEDRTQLAEASAELQDIREHLADAGLAVRVAAFRSVNPRDDIARLAVEQDAELMLVDGTEPLGPGELRSLVEGAPCDVGIVIEGQLSDGPVLVPFVGAEDDWSAIDVGAHAARALSVPLRLAGPSEADRDSSRLLASAALAVQRALGVRVEPLLVDPATDDLETAAATASIVVVGLPDGWQTSGLGKVRTRLTDRCTVPVVIVHRGARPGGIAAAEGYTRFTWSVGSVV